MDITDVDTLIKKLGKYAAVLYLNKIGIKNENMETSIHGNMQSRICCIIEKGINSRNLMYRIILTEK